MFLTSNFYNAFRKYNNISISYIKSFYNLFNTVPIRQYHYKLWIIVVNFHFINDNGFSFHNYVVIVFFFK